MSTTPTFQNEPDIKVSVKKVFNIDSDMTVDAFSKKNDYVPEIDNSYIFDRETTLAILAGFSNTGELLQGFHGTGNQLI